ncbi:hypothetical protein NEOLEDRAFT_1149961 [Neolentinus lepideus HHB14362 ss-1]|uniref:Glucose receptor Git3 N-terminal domain-containing protein n=1 Tax=Neolentinus lepideus HHB14362 ss-1 TaxID=1314782 RepID=A0A165QLI6_9AGAM|nr:hypothetical protein NEOLEDRAFT_1149961 [Neolentinus lepideus HHB14362 ss-1]
MSGPSGPSIHCLTRAQSIGIAFSVEAATVALSSIMILFLISLRNFISSRYRGRVTNGPIERPVDLYVLFLFIFGTLEALGGIANVKWAYEGKVYTGNGRDWYGHDNLSHRVAHIRCAVGEATLCSDVVMSRVRGEYFDRPTPSWCWIGEKYTVQRLAGEYIWMWTTLIASVAAYIPLYFLWRGNVTVDGVHWWKFHVHRRAVNTENSGKLSLSMLAWYQFAHPYPKIPTQSVIPTGVTFLCDVIFRIGPVFNVMLYVRTRPELSLFGLGTRISRQVVAPSLSIAELPESATLCKGVIEYFRIRVVFTQPVQAANSMGQILVVLQNITAATGVNSGNIQDICHPYA